jgi:hypothetical protein
LQLIFLGLGLCYIFETAKAARTYMAWKNYFDSAQVIEVKTDNIKKLCQEELIDTKWEGWDYQCMHMVCKENNLNCFSEGDMSLKRGKYSLWEKDKIKFPDLNGDGKIGKN